MRNHARTAIPAALALALCAGADGCGKGGGPGAAEPAQPAIGEILEISLGISAPSSTATVVIDGEGNLSYDATAYPPAEELRAEESSRVVLTPAQLQALVTLIDETGILSLDSAEWQVQGEDCPSGGITVGTVGGGVKSFGFTCGSPEEFDRIRSMIEDLLGQPILQEGF